MDKMKQNVRCPGFCQYRRLERGTYRSRWCTGNVHCRIPQHTSTRHKLLLLSLNVDDSDNEGVIFSFKFILFTERTSFIHSLNSTGSLHLTQLISSIHPSIHLTDDPGECQSYWQPQSAAASSEHAMRIGKQIVMNYETHTHTPPWTQRTLRNPPNSTFDGLNWLPRPAAV